MITSEDRRRFITAFMTTICIFAFLFGFWYISGKCVYMAAETAAGQGATDGGVSGYQIFLCFRDCIRGVAPYIAFVIDLFVFICVVICNHMF